MSFVAGVFLLIAVGLQFAVLAALIRVNTQLIFLIMTIEEQGSRKRMAALFVTLENFVVDASLYKKVSDKISVASNEIKRLGLIATSLAEDMRTTYDDARSMQRIMNIKQKTLF
jgi:TctA family transporter